MSKQFFFKKIQLNESIVSMSKTFPLQAIQFSISMQFNFQKPFYFKLLSLVK